MNPIIAALGMIVMFIGLTLVNTMPLYLGEFAKLILILLIFIFSSVLVLYSLK